MLNLHSIFCCYSKPTPFACFIFTLLSCIPGNMSYFTECAQYKTIVFDSNGTLVDVNDLLKTTQNVINSTNPTTATTLINLWRSKQLDYTWLRSLMKSPTTDTYKDFWEVTQDALKFSLAKLELSLTQSQQDELMNGCLRLSVFPDVKHALTELKQKYQLAVLSNGSPRMLRELFKNNGLDDLIDPDNEISVDECPSLALSKAKSGALKDFLGTVKDIPPDLHKSGIYRIQCSHCGRCYYGMTIRKLFIRFNEHVNSARWKRKTAVGRHIFSSSHTVNISELKLIQPIQQMWKIEYFEAIHIHKHKHENLLNVDDGNIQSPLLDLFVLERKTHDNVIDLTEDTPDSSINEIFYECEGEVDEESDRTQRESI